MFHKLEKKFWVKVKKLAWPPGLRPSSFREHGTDDLESKIVLSDSQCGRNQLDYSRMYDSFLTYMLEVKKSRYPAKSKKLIGMQLFTSDEDEELEGGREEMGQMAQDDDIFAAGVARKRAPPEGRRKNAERGKQAELADDQKRDDEEGSQGQSRPAINHVSLILPRMFDRLPHRTPTCLPNRKPRVKIRSRKGFLSTSVRSSPRNSLDLSNRSTASGSIPACPCVVRGTRLNSCRRSGTNRIQWNAAESPARRRASCSQSSRTILCSKRLACSLTRGISSNRRNGLKSETSKSGRIDSCWTGLFSSQWKGCHGAPTVSEPTTFGGVSGTLLRHSCKRLRTPPLLPLFVPRVTPLYP